MLQHFYESAADMDQITLISDSMSFLDDTLPLKIELLEDNDSPHIEITTVEKQQYYCEICKKFLQTKNNLYIHNREQHSSNIAWYECAKCGYKSKRRIDKDRHEINCYNEPCDYCGKIIKTTGKLQRHIEENHKNEDKPEKPPIPIRSKNKKPTPEKKDRVKRDRRRDKSTDKPVKTEDSLQQLKPDQYFCEICNKDLHTRNNLYVHNREQHTLKIGCYECSKCDYKSKRRIDRDRHELNCYNEPCEYCGKNIRSTGWLRRHMEEDHKDLLPHIDESIENSSCIETLEI